MSGVNSTAGLSRPIGEMAACSRGSIREETRVTVDLPAAVSFLATHGRVLDRRRLALLLGDADPAGALAALDGYRNPDGGYSWGLEPDLRAPESQPAGALHAFEVFQEIAPAVSSRATELCDWLDSATLADGGLPFALPVADPAGCASFWAEADATASSLHITAAVAAAGVRVGRHDPAVARHRWLSRATEYCLGAIASMDRAGHALELKYTLDLLDAISDDRPEAAAHIERFGAAIPDDGCVHVGGGLEDEMMRPLDFAPLPDRRVRALFSADVVEADLERLAGLQEEDGGWRPDFASASPAAALEWRGYMTVRAITILRRNGRVR